MNPSRIFILRPVATSLMMAAVILVGIVAFRQLPVSENRLGSFRLGPARCARLRGVPDFPPSLSFP